MKRILATAVVGIALVLPLGAWADTLDQIGSTIKSKIQDGKGTSSLNSVENNGARANRELR